jgi:acyl-CoA thioester hydrolase
MSKDPISLYKVRFSDCDLFGHLNNARYLDYLMNAREDHLKEFYNLDLTIYYKKNLAWVVSSHEIAYVRPAIYNELVAIQSTLLKADNDSLYLEIIMMDELKAHLKAILRTKLTAINMKTGRREKHLPEFMEWARSVENNDSAIELEIGLRIKQVIRGLES